MVAAFIIHPFCCAFCHTPRHTSINKYIYLIDNYAIMDDVHHICIHKDVFRRMLSDQDIPQRYDLIMEELDLQVRYFEGQGINERWLNNLKRHIRLIRNCVTDNCRVLGRATTAINSSDNIYWDIEQYGAISPYAKESLLDAMKEADYYWLYQIFKKYNLIKEESV